MQVFIFRIDMKFFYFFWYLIAVAASAISFATVEENYTAADGTIKKMSYIRFRNVPESPKLTPEECREFLLHKCGDRMVLMMKFPAMLSYKRFPGLRCRMRKRFFECMKEENQPCEPWRRQFIDSKFRKELTDFLWSSRGCILGLSPSITGYEN